MSQYLETLDQSESLGKPFLGSLVLHVGIAALALLYEVAGFNKPSNFIGSPNPGGGAVGISVVHAIPLPPKPGLENPLANDSKTVVPLPPPEKAKPKTKAKAPEPDAIPIPSKKAQKKPSEIARTKPTYRAPGRDQPNQLYSDIGPAMKSPMIQQNGAGGVGIGQGSTLGTRFGWYADLVITRVAQHWNPDAQQQSNQAAIVTFTLMKDGSVKDVRLSQRSGNTIMDFACQRAVLDSAPFQPIPDGAGNSVNIELVFKGKL
jgi:protein TonB